MSCPNFIAECFALRTAIHLKHLSPLPVGAAGTDALHRALAGFYEGLVELTDRYAEVYQGLNQIIKKYPPVAMLTDFLDVIREEYAEEGDESQALLNILAEIEELTARTLYKLRFLK